MIWCSCFLSSPERLDETTWKKLPLPWAVSAGNLSAVSFLMQHGGNPMNTSNGSESPLCCAVSPCTDGPSGNDAEIISFISLISLISLIGLIRLISDQIRNNETEMKACPGFTLLTCVIRAFPDSPFHWLGPCLLGTPNSFYIFLLCSSPWNPKSTNLWLPLLHRLQRWSIFYKISRINLSALGISWKPCELPARATLLIPGRYRWMVIRGWRK